ncbi:unnamed protein product [Knipowitschia caucasica]
MHRNSLKPCIGPVNEATERTPETPIEQNVPNQSPYYLFLNPPVNPSVNPPAPSPRRSGRSNLGQPPVRFRPDED